jgi:hypothetical protein
MKRIYKQAIGVWILFIILAIVNGAIRTLVYGPVIGDELLAHQISTVTAIIFFLAVMYVFFRWTTAHYDKKDLLVIGVMWLGLTIGFEFIFGHYIMGHPWSRLLADYNICEGRVWGLVLLTVVVGPFFVGNYLVGGCSTPPQK